LGRDPAARIEWRRPRSARRAGGPRRRQRDRSAPGGVGRKAIVGPVPAVPSRLGERSGGPAFDWRMRCRRR
jgi:hypothetical protein